MLAQKKMGAMSKCFGQIPRAHCLDSQNKQRIYIYIYIFFFRFFSIIGYYKILRIVPCVIQLCPCWLSTPYVYIYSSVFF